MLISIITPVYNSASTIAENIKSVISQTFTNFEHIIVDNLSTDNSLEIARKLYSQAGMESRLKIISEPDKGISDAFNKGISASKGDVITILNSDDLFYNNNVLHSIVTVFSGTNKLIVHGDLDFKDNTYGSNVRQPLFSKPIGIVYNHPGMFIHREVYSVLGLYNSLFRYSMDYEFYCRIKKQYNDTEKISEYISSPLVSMQAGGASWNNEVKSIKEIRSALKMHGLWNIDGKLYFLGRISKARIKKYFTLLGLTTIVKFWRKLKWKA